LAKTDKNNRIIEKNSITKSSMYNNIKIIKNNDALIAETIEINKITNNQSKIDNITQDEEKEKYIFKKSAKNSLSKTLTSIKMSPIRIENSLNDNNITKNCFNKTFVNDLVSKNTKLESKSIFDTNKSNIKEKRKSRIQPKINSYSNIKKRSKILNSNNVKRKRKTSLNSKSFHENKNIIMNEDNKSWNEFGNNKHYTSQDNYLPEYKLNIKSLEKSENIFEQKEAVQLSMKNKINYKINNQSIKNIGNPVELIHEDLKKLAITAQDKRLSSNVYKFLCVENPNNLIINKNPPKNLVNELSVKEDYKLSLKSDSLIKTSILYSNQKLDINKFLNQTKSIKINEDYLDIEIERPDFVKNFTNNNGFDNSNKTDLIEMSNINYSNYCSVNAEIEKDLILNFDENTYKQCKNFENKGKKANNKENYSKNHNIEDQKLYNTAGNFNKNFDDTNEGRNNDLLKSDKKKKSSIIDRLTQEARDQAIIKVVSEKIIPENQNSKHDNDQSINSKIGNNSNRSGIINNYNNFYFTEYHTYTGRKKNVKTFK